MFEEMSPPIDSYDCYAMGLRAPRCNGCKYAKLKYQLGDRFLSLRDDNGWVSVYELDAKPVRGQAVVEHDGRSIKAYSSFMSVGHSDECYHWQPPKDGQ